MGGIWYALTRVIMEPVVGKDVSKKMASKNETAMRKALRETVVPLACAAGAGCLGPAGMLTAAALGKNAAGTIYPADKDN